uniref:SAF domain-containing protein n=1 Tax=Geoglobus ahangari TaxID=113653 RepID=A0A7C4W3S4_9EURY
MRVYIHNEKDNVAVALEDLKPGERIKISKGGFEVGIEIKQEIPFGHKIALEKIKAGEKVVKYGEVIGMATSDINPGEHVHVHNLKSLKYT